MKQLLQDIPLALRICQRRKSWKGGFCQNGNGRGRMDMQMLEQGAAKVH